MDFNMHLAGSFELISLTSPLFSPSTSRQRMQRWGYQAQRGGGELCARSDATLLTGLLWRILAVLQDIATVALPIGILLQECFDSSRR